MKNCSAEMKGILLVLIGIKALTADWAISLQCQVAEDVLLGQNESMKIFQSKNRDDTGVYGKVGALTLYRCWRVVPRPGVPPNQFVKIEIDNLQSDVCVSPYKHGLKIMNGIRLDVNETIADRCSTNSDAEMGREVFYSTQQSVFIQWIDSYIRGEKGVDITVSLIQANTESMRECTADTWSQPGSATITSDNYPQNYESNTNQCWRYTDLDESRMFEVTITEEMKLNVPFAGACYDRLDIYALGISKNVLLHRMCSSDYEGRYIYIAHEDIFLRFTSDSLNEDKGFEMNIRTVPKTQPFKSDCTSIIMHPSSLAVTLTSPNYPEQYPNNLDMCWTISLEETAHSDMYQINVYNVGEFGLDPEWNSECDDYSANTFSYDRLDFIPDKGEVESRCGSEQNFDLKFNKTFRIRFRTDDILTATGFKLLLMPEPIECEELLVWPGLPIITLESGLQNIMSDSEKCWRLKTREEIVFSVIRDQFTGSKFRLQININKVELFPNDDCRSDFLKIYDGSSTNLARSYCPGDNTTFQRYFSSSSAVTIKLRFSGPRSYNISVKAMHEGMVQAMERYETRTSNFCSRKTFTRYDPSYRKHVAIYQFGYFKNPEFSGECVTYSISDAQPGDRLQLKVDWARTSFGPPADNCRTRFITVYDGPSYDSPVLTHICWEQINMITSSGPSMTFVAVAKDQEQFHGDLIVLEGNRYNDGCIEIPINDTSVEYFVSSPNHPSKYPNNQDICWIAYLVQPDPSLRLSFDVERFDDKYYEEYTPCNNGDTLKLSDDSQTFYNTTFCDRDNGLFHPGMSYEQECMDRKYLKLHFTSDSKNDTNGFYGSFKAIQESKIFGCFGERNVGPGSSEDSNKGAVIGIVLGCIGGVLVLGILVYFVRKKCKSDRGSRSQEQYSADERGGFPTEQEQIAQVSAPPSYNDVVQRNDLFPVSDRSSSVGAGGANEGAVSGYAHGARYDASYQEPDNAQSNASDTVPNNARSDVSYPPTYPHPDQGAINLAFYSPRNGVSISTVL